jgi:hypothetical protein
LAISSSIDLLYALNEKVWRGGLWVFSLPSNWEVTGQGFMLEKSVLLEDKIRINHLLNTAFIKSVFYTSEQISQIFLKLLMT